MRFELGSIVIGAISNPSVSATVLVTNYSRTGLSPSCFDGPDRLEA
jgi:hypothetical protein